MKYNKELIRKKRRIPRTTVEILNIILKIKIIFTVGGGLAGW
jgi:hypothetical protein